MGEARKDGAIFRMKGDIRPIKDDCNNTIATVTFKEKNCLRCDVKFRSSGKHNRLCCNCRHQNFNCTSPWAVEQGSSVAGTRDHHKFSDTPLMVWLNPAEEPSHNKDT